MFHSLSCSRPQNQALGVTMDFVVFCLFLISKNHLPYLASRSCQGCSLRWKNLRVKFRPDSDSGGWKRPRFFFLSFFLWGRAGQISIELFPTLSKTSVFPLCGTLLQNRGTDEKCRFKALSQWGVFMIVAGACSSCLITLMSAHIHPSCNVCLAAGVKLWRTHHFIGSPADRIKGDT